MGALFVMDPTTMAQRFRAKPWQRGGMQECQQGPSPLPPLDEFLPLPLES